MLVSADAGSIPKPVLERAQDCILDALGSALAGRDMGSTRSMQAVISARALPGASSIWQGAKQCDPISAATINAMAATALDVDDGHRRAAGHPGAAVVATALAVAENQNSSMTELLVATVVGYEAAIRVALARNPDHHTSTVSGRWSGVGATAAAAWLLKLPATTMEQAILIAEQHAPRASSAKHHGFAGSDVKEAIAWSVHSGLYAVELAHNGFAGYPDTFEQGILYDPAALCADFDQFTAIDGLFFKPYACCRWIHSAIDGLREIISQNALDAENIQLVRVKTFDQAVGLGNHTAPNSEAQAQFSIPFCLGAVAVRGADALIPMDPTLLEDDCVGKFAQKVSILQDAEMNARFPIKVPAVVEATAAGVVYQVEVDAAFGDPTNPMKREDLQDKFRKLTNGRISTERQARTIAALSGLPQTSKKPVRELFENLSTA